MRLEAWILQIMVWRIILERRRPWFPTVLRATGPHLSHTCPTKHLKVQSYEDTCTVACAAKKGNEFERQPSLSGLQDTVRAHFVRPLKVAELILLKTSHSPLTIATKTLGLSIIGEKYTVASWKRLVALSCLVGEDGRNG